MPRRLVAVDAEAFDLADAELADATLSDRPQLRRHLAPRGDGATESRPTHDGAIVLAADIHTVSMRSHDLVLVRFRVRERIDQDEASRAVSLGEADDLRDRVVVDVVTRFARVDAAHAPQRPRVAPLATEHVAVAIVRRRHSERIFVALRDETEIGKDRLHRG